ncbi:Phage tail sheath protein [compost metagenome]
MEFSTLDFPTIGLLVQAVNSYPLNNVVKLSTANRFLTADTKDLQVQPVTRLAGGADGVRVTKQQLFEALGGVRDVNGFVTAPGAYQLLENYTVDTVIPLGVYADDELPGKYDSFSYQLALACAVMSHRNSTTHGIIATSSPDEVGLAAIDAHVKKLLALGMSFNMRDRLGNEIKDSDGKKIDLGRFISVVAGPDVNLGSSRFGVYAENTPGVYGGMISNMAVQSAPTNKPVPGVLSLRFNYSNSQLDALTAARFVTLRTKQNGAVVSVTDAMTAAQPTSDYRRLVTYRVVKEAVNEVRAVCDPYIGEPNEVQQRNAMSAAISKRLDRMKEAGALTDYTFQVIATPEMQLLGQAQIELTIVPPMELRQITTVVSLRATL